MRLNTSEGLPSLRLPVGNGGRCRNAEGREFIDFRMAFGANLLGYAYGPVNDAIAAQLDRGVLFSSPHPLERSLRARLAQLFPCTGGEPTAVLFRKTGSEAVSAAVRIARAYTGRERVLRSGYHGWHDWCADGVFARFYGDRTAAKSWPRGIPRTVAALTTRFDANDLDSLEVELASRARETACLVIAPEDLLPPLESTLVALKNLADRYEVLLILDEIKTAFRARLGGVQAMACVAPDMTTVSKGLANGLPLAATLGRPDIMALAPTLLLSSTYAEDLVSIAAAHATLDAITTHDVIPRLWHLGQRFIDGVNAAARHRGMSDQIAALAWPLPPMPFVQVRGTALNPDRFQDLLEESGVLLYSDHPNFVCFSHTEAEIERSIAACLASVDRMAWS